MSKITTASKDSKDVDLILADLRVHYADPHVAILTLAQCHGAAGPILDPEVHKISQPDPGMIHCTVGIL